MRVHPALVVPLVLAACGLLTFTVEQESSTTVEGAGLLGEVLGALDFTGLNEFDVTIEQEMADQGVEPGDLESVTLTTLSLAAEPDLSFLISMDVYVGATGVDEVLVASAADFPEGQSTVELTPTGANLAAAVVAGDMKFRVEASGSAPVEDTEVDIFVEVEVTGTPQGACNQL